MLHFLLINGKTPSIVGILTFMSRGNFMLHEFSFYNLRPEGRYTAHIISSCCMYTRVTLKDVNADNYFWLDLTFAKLQNNFKLSKCYTFSSAWQTIYKFRCII